MVVTVKTTATNSKYESPLTVQEVPVQNACSWMYNNLTLPPRCVVLLFIEEYVNINQTLQFCSS